ncbi:hypothetical protein DPMN_184588 [Dreissena polymorpha]|uniref:Uncharacterized protein n=1 Tax=Dreissena polymorpha TaxID=45954 RepID=A0A9D4I813_DREPO|nr:hypothetical protein DPMN_184588 [Dreissena polymorpha]
MHSIHPFRSFNNNLLSADTGITLTLCRILQCSNISADFYRNYRSDTDPRRVERLAGVAALFCNVRHGCETTVPSL